MDSLLKIYWFFSLMLEHLADFTVLAFAVYFIFKFSGPNMNQIKSSVMTALNVGPKTSAEIIQYCVDHKLAIGTTTRLHIALNQLIAEGKVVKEVSELERPIYHATNRQKARKQRNKHRPLARVTRLPTAVGRSPA